MNVWYLQSIILVFLEQVLPVINSIMLLLNSQWSLLTAIWQLWRRNVSTTSQLIVKLTNWWDWRERKKLKNVLSQQRKKSVHHGTITTRFSMIPSSRTRFSWTTKCWIVEPSMNCLSESNFEMTSPYFLMRTNIRNIISSVIKQTCQPFLFYFSIRVWQSDQSLPEKYRTGLDVSESFLVAQFLL